ncbi:hypothetical protein ISS96_02100 [Candidatus Bathyarchaeota archaeon]|nr:hypothetical protein [Candidatus Bathyarchaeota archaeon]
MDSSKLPVIHLFVDGVVRLLPVLSNPGSTGGTIAVPEPSAKPLHSLYVSVMFAVTLSYRLAGRGAYGRC